MATILTCRVCMTDFALPDGLDLMDCPACGATHSRPQAEGDALDKLQRATRLRLACDFAAAEKCYDHVLMDHDDEHEALWGRLLCLYGVEHVVDPKTGVRHPLVHIPRRKPLQEQADFLQACELAPAAVRAQYEADAAYIDEAQAEIRSLADNCPPYDVFICHKTTLLDSDAKTEDYNRAFLLYHKLDKLGYRVFFAPVEMEGVAAGANYEAAIYHALHTARVMLVVCSDPAYIASTWVQSEWKRYLELVDEHADRCLLPLLYGTLPASKLPREYRLRKIEAVTMEGWDAQENVLKVLHKFCGEKGQAQPVPQPAPAPAPTPVPAVAPAKPKPVQPAYQPAPKPSAAVGHGGVVMSELGYGRLEEAKTAVRYTPESHFRIMSADGGCSIIEYTGSSGEVIIPPTIQGKKTVEIGQYAFKQQTELTKVVIPDNVTRISLEAFAGCSNLTSITISDSVTHIASGAFRNCSSLSSVELPASLTEITNNPFESCRSLRSITVAAENKMYVACDNVLLSRENEIVCYPAGLQAASYAIPDIVTRIGDGAFCGCSSLTNVILPDSLTSIGNVAFANCSGLMSVTIPGGVTRLGHQVFWHCNNLKSITFPDSLTSISHGVCEYCSNLTNIMVPEGVTRIEGWAFRNCSSLTNITLPNSVTEIGFAVFAECPTLVIRVHSGSYAHSYAQQNGIPVELLHSQAPETDFQVKPADGGCTITKYTGPGGQVDIPSTLDGMKVVEIGESAFENCTALTGVAIPEGVKNLQMFAFGGCTGLTSVRMPSSVRNIYGFAFENCSALPAISIPEGVVYLSSDVFDGCVSLTDVSLPASLTQIKWNPFPNCTALKTIRVAQANMFYAMRDNILMSREGMLHCYPAGLTASSYRIPEYVTAVSHLAFAGCRSLKTITIPAGVKTFDPYAFGHEPECTLRVHEGSAAHEYVRKNNLRFEVIAHDGGAAKPNVDKPAAKPVSQAVKPQPSVARPAAPAPAELLILRSKRFNSSARQLSVRIDEKEVLHVANGESVLLKLNPGRHRVDIKLKPLMGGEVNWDSVWCQKDIFKETMQSGKRYTIDLANWLAKLII